MPVINRLKFRKDLNKNLLIRDRAKSRSLAAEHELKRAEHHIKTLPALKGTTEERRVAVENRDRKLRDLHKLEMNSISEAADVARANRRVNASKDFRKQAPVGGLRIGQAIANILLGSNKVSGVTRNIKRVFSISKNSEKKKPLVVSKSAERLTYKKGTPSGRGPMMGRTPRK